MKIVIEGYDNSGKSTLIESVSKILDLPVHWAGGPPANHVIALGDSATQLKMTNIIHDRVTPISRQCYESVDNIKCEIKYLRKAIEIMIHRGTKFIYCTGVGDEHILSECDSYEHLQYLEANEADIRARYVEIFKHIPHFNYDFRKNDVSAVINYINGDLNAFKRNCSTIG